MATPDSTAPANVPMPNAPKGNTGSRLQSLPKPFLYGLLILACLVPQFFTIPLPNTPDVSSVALYQQLMQLGPNDRVLLASDWTNSTRGESRAHFLTFVKILIERKVKFAMYSTGGPEAPQAAIDTIVSLNAQRVKDGKAPYRRWEDWVNVGYFSDSEAATNGIANDLRSTFAPKRDVSPGGSKPVFDSPVLQGIRRVQDFKLLVVITASKTSNFTIERVYGKTPLAFMVTGVMGPESQVFFQSDQIEGLASGLKGAYDMEQLIAKGITTADGTVLPAAIPNDPPGQGTKFYPALHFAMALMVLMIVLGNVGMFLTKRGMRS